MRDNKNIEWNGIISNIKTFTSGFQEAISRKWPHFSNIEKAWKICGYGHLMKDNVNVKWNKLFYNIKTSTSRFQEAISRKKRNFSNIERNLYDVYLYQLKDYVEFTTLKLQILAITLQAMSFLGNWNKTTMK